MLFSDDLAVELVLVALLLRQDRVAPFFEMGEPAFQPAGLAPVEPDGDARQRRQEAAVVADDHQRGAPRSEIALQPFDRAQVEVVGRLVEQQDVGRGRQHPRERGAARFAAGEMRRMLVAGKAELLEQIAGGVTIVGRAEPVLDIGEGGFEAGEVRLLRQIAERHPGLHEHRAAVRLDGPCRDFQQGRFAGPIASDQRNPFARGDGQLRAGQQRGAAEGQRDILELKEGWGHTTVKYGLDSTFYKQIVKIVIKLDRSLKRVFRFCMHSCRSVVQPRGKYRSVTRQGADQWAISSG